MKYLKLYNGNSLPAVGMGLYTLKSPDLINNVLTWADEEGYELIDTAYFYENENMIGETISSLGLKNFKLASKIWPSDFGADATKRSIERSLKLLKTDHLEIMYLHWPGEDSAESWKILENYYEQGVFKNIGVCNFYKNHLDKLSTIANIKPQIDQIETHPLLTLDDFINYLHSEQIQPMAWGPLARGDESLFKNPNLIQIATSHNVTVGQVILKYNISRDVIVIPRTTKRSRAHENIDLFNFELSDEELKLISSLNQDFHTSHSPNEDNWLKEIRNKC